jgi:Trypsin
MRAGVWQVLLVGTYAFAPACKKWDVPTSTPTHPPPPVSYVFEETRETAPDPELMQLIVSLEGEPGRHGCTATPISDSVVLTAAHCLESQTELHVLVPDSVGFLVPWKGNARKCKGHDCSQPLPEGFAGISQDIGTARAEGLVAPSYPALGRVLSNELPAVYLLSARRPTPLAVCRSRVLIDYGETLGATVTFGDSGSPLVARTHDGVVVVGVESHIKEADGHWYFVVIPSELPWPGDATTSRPEVNDIFDFDYFDAIPECQT